MDWMTICIYLMLVIFGWFSVCGASYDYGEIDFFSFDTRAGKQFVWICCSLGLGFILMMLEDKLYDMFAYILYGGMMLLLLITPFLAEDTKGSYSWIKFGPVSLQPAEFAKFATALALAKFMNVYGFTMSKLKYSLPVVGMVLLPMLLIILQRETGSALVYLAFFFMLYREGMPGSILFAGICAVVYFVVGIRFGNELMADDCTSIGEFSVLLLIVILSALLVNSYCKKASVVWYIGGVGVGGTLLALLFSFFLVVAYLGYVIGLFEVGVLFVQFVLSAQVSGPDAVFFFGQSYVSHSSLQVVIVRPPQKDGGCHGCFGAFHHLSFFASINNRRLRLGIRIRIRIGIGIGIGIGIRTWVYFFCISLSTCFMEIHVRHLQRRRGCCQPFRNRRLPFQVLFSVFVGFIVQFACQGIQYIVHLLIVSHRNSAVIRHHGN